MKIFTHLKLPLILQILKTKTPFAKCCYLLLLFFGVLIIPANVFAQTKTSTGGNWNTAGTWSPSGVPGAGDSVVINSGNVTLDVNATVGALTIKNNGLHFSATANRTLIVTAASGRSGDVSILSPNGILYIGEAAGQILNVAGNLTCGNGITWSLPPNPKIVFNGTGNKILNNTSGQGSFEVNSPTLILTVTAQPAFIEGNITVTAGTLDASTFDLTMNSATAGQTLSVANGATFKVGGTGSLPTGFPTYTFGASSTVEFYGAAQTITKKSYGNLTLSGSGIKTMPGTSMTLAGNFTTSGTVTATAVNALLVSGNFTVGTGTTFSGSTFSHTVGGNFSNSGTFTASTGTFTFNGTIAQSIGGSTTPTTFNNLTIAGSNTVTANVNCSVLSNLLVSTGTLDLGSFTANRFSAGGTLTVSNGATLKIGGTNTLPSNYSTHSIGATSTVEYGGTTQSVVVLNSAQDYGHLIISGSGTKTLAGTENVAGNLTISAGTFDLGANTINRTTAGGSLTLSSGAALKIGGTNTLPSSYSTHSIAATSTVEYSGTSQSVVVLNSAQDYGNLIISGSGTKTLAGSITVRGTLTLTAGTLSANNLNISVGGNWIHNSTFTPGTGTVTFNGAGTQTVSGSQTLNVFNLVTNNSSGITLNTDLSISGAHTFSAGLITTSATPNYLIYAAGSSYSGDGDTRHVNGWVKKSGSTNFTFPVGDATYERVVDISNLSASSEINCKYNRPTNNTINLFSPLAMVKANEYWQMDKVSGGTAQVTLNWDHSKVAMDNVLIVDILSSQYTAGNWTSTGGTASGNVTTTGTITSNALGSFGPLTFGYTSFPVSLKLLSFTAIRAVGTSFLKWVTENEQNVDRFEVQRSYDGNSFTTIGHVAARNNGSREVYDFEDHSALNGIAYYRIKSVDIDGKLSYSKIAAVSEHDLQSTTFVVLNPARTIITILNKSGENGPFDYFLYNVVGRLLLKGNTYMGINGGAALPLPEHIPAGIYILELSNDKVQFRQKIMIEK